MNKLLYRHRSARAAGRLAAATGIGALMLTVAPAATAATRSLPPARTAAARAVAMSASPVVAMAPSSGDGYWLASAGGGVFSFGSAVFHGSAGGMNLASPVVAMAAQPDGGGYWLVTRAGGVFSFGTASFHGSPAQYKMSSPAVGMASSPSGNGYWIVTADGSVFSFGDAAFHGSASPYRPASPIVGMAATPTGNGYWLLSARGGLFSFGGAGFHGSAANIALATPAVGLASTPSGNGYWIATAAGGVFNYGDAPFDGTAVADVNAAGVRAVAIASVGSGYWIPTNVGHITSAGAPAAPESTATVYLPPAPAPAPVDPVSAYQLPAEVMPGADTQPTAAFDLACWSVPLNPASCDAAALIEINAARASEGYGPLVLPSDYSSLPVPSQVLAVANAERTSRGLPALPENGYLDSLAAAGASADGGRGADPTGPYGYGWGSNIAWGEPTALAADFSWMYNDGPGGENIDCTAAGQAGCWGHRENILAPWGGASGAGEYVNNGSVQLTQLFVENY
jgi:hypothetical protein